HNVAYVDSMRMSRVVKKYVMSMTWHLCDNELSRLRATICTESLSILDETKSCRNVCCGIRRIRTESQRCPRDRTNRCPSDNVGRDHDHTTGKSNSRENSRGRRTRCRRHL